MRILLDTHAMLWWLADDPRLSDVARGIFADGRNRLVWSLASSWEIAIKVGIGRLKLARPLPELYSEIVSGPGVELLHLSHDHCTALGAVPLLHREPFDRMLVAQARAERLPILSADAKLSGYEVDVRW